MAQNHISFSSEISSAFFSRDIAPLLFTKMPGMMMEKDLIAKNTNAAFIYSPQSHFIYSNNWL